MAKTVSDTRVLQATSQPNMLVRQEFNFHFFSVLFFSFKTFCHFIICEWMRRKFVQFCTQLGSLFRVHYGLCYRYYPPSSDLDKFEKY